MKNQAHTITRKIAGGLYEVEHCPADSNVYACFIIHKEGNEWRITDLRTFSIYASTKKDAVSFIKTITRSLAPHLFPN